MLLMPSFVIIVEREGSESHIIEPWFISTNSATTNPLQVLQLAINSHRYHKHQADYDGGVHRVAWAFLRLAGGGPPGPGGGSGPLLGRLPLQVRGKGGDISGQPTHPSPRHLYTYFPRLPHI